MFICLMKRVRLPESEAQQLVNWSRLPSKEDHLHLSTGEHFSDPCYFDEVTLDLLDLLLSGDWVQLFILVSI